MTFKRCSLPRALVLMVILLLLVLSPPSFGEPEVSYYSDRFLFRGKDLDEMVLVLLNFNRAREAEKYTGEFFGAVFYRNHWTFLEGNDKYPYAPKDLQQIQPSYFAKAEGSPVSGFKIHYDGGDFTISLSSGPIQTLYTPNGGPLIKNSVGVGEAVLTLHGKEYWGELIHEPLVWDGFNGLEIRYKGLFKEYHAFYLTTEKGREIYLRQNRASPKAFRNKYRLTESLQTNGGFVRSGSGAPTVFKRPIFLSPLATIQPLFAFYSIPQRWKVEAPAVGTLYLWSRESAEKNWVWGGYYLMAIEGILKTGNHEERVWGMAEYIP